MFNYAEIKKELSEMMSLSNSELAEVRKTSLAHSLSGWKIFNEKFNKQNHFKNIHKLIQALYCLPYANGDVERSFNHLKIIKNQRRTQLSDQNLSSLMILNSVTKKRKVRDFDELLQIHVLRRVKL